MTTPSQDDDRPEWLVTLETSLGINHNDPVYLKAQIYHAEEHARRLAAELHRERTLRAKMHESLIEARTRLDRSAQNHVNLLTDVNENWARDVRIAEKMRDEAAQTALLDAAAAWHDIGDFVSVEQWLLTRARQVGPDQEPS